MDELDNKYFVAKITIDMPDPESGKIKKTKEEKLLQHSIAAAIILESYLPFFKSQND